MLDKSYFEGEHKGKKNLRFTLSLSSQEDILKFSHGEVSSPDIFKSRSHEFTGNGLFSTIIFGTLKNYQCDCGAVKGRRGKVYKCPRCGVDVTSSFVRRRRLGHIVLPIPVILPLILHLKSKDNPIKSLIGLAKKDLRAVARYEKFVVMKSSIEDLEVGKLIEPSEYKSFYEDDRVEISGGAPCIKALIKKICKDKELHSDKVSVLKSLEKIGLTPYDFIHSIIPVIPPDLRPLAFTDEGSIICSGLNEHYRRVLIRCKRIKNLISAGAPVYVLAREASNLQNVVECLFDNERAKHPVVDRHGALLPSLIDRLKGKEGRFRGSLLGKRQDYSGRSVIVPNPTLKINECGLPIKMAKELFKPYILSHLHNAHNYDISRAIYLFKKDEPEILDALVEVIKDKMVILNRQPTLHRLGMQAFFPKITNSRAIEIHPLVCQGYNADFDGDQMAVYIPLSDEARQECQNKLLMEKNIFTPSSGDSVMSPTLEASLGIYLATLIKDKKAKTSFCFADFNEARLAFETDHIDLNDRITCRVSDNIFETCFGRLQIYELIPRHKDFPFEKVNKVFRKSDLKVLTKEVFFHTEKSRRESLEFCDRLWKYGVELATLSGVTLTKKDFKLPDGFIDNELKVAINNDKTLNEQYRAGLITEETQKVKSQEVWMAEISKFEDSMMSQMAKDNIDGIPQNNLYSIVDSESRGSRPQLRQLVGLKGVVKDIKASLDDAKIIKSSLFKGMNPMDYFNTISGSRGGLLDTIMKTAFCGYLTRILVKSLEVVEVRDADCETDKVGMFLETQDSYGRVLAKEFCGIPSGTMIDEEIFDKIKSSEEKVEVRSPMSCALMVRQEETDDKFDFSPPSVCQKCYGYDLSTHKVAQLNTPVGVIAAHAISEPTTQLTLRTFHFGGSAHVESGSKDVVHIIDGAKIIMKTLNSSSTSTNTFEEKYNKVKEIYDLHGIDLDSKHLELACKISALFGRMEDSIYKGSRGFLASASFARVNSALSEAIARGVTDHLVDPSSKIMTGKIVPNGEN